MEETFKDECNTYYKIFSQKGDPTYKYRFLSPFEFKNILIKLAVKKAGSIDKILNIRSLIEEYYIDFKSFSK